MAVDIDIFNPQYSTVSRGLESKSFVVYGSNRTAKTLVGCNLPKPYYLGFENGINAIAGVPYIPITNWATFLKICKQLTKPETLEKVKERYQTIVFDTLEAAARYCEEYVCAKYGVETIASGRGGYGLWKELSLELWKPLNQLCGCGFTTYFIGHDGTREFTLPTGEKYEKIYPRGEKRLVDVAIDSADFIIYVKPNGIGEDGKEIPSSAYCRNTNEYHAGSRFRFFPEKIDVWSAENLTNAVSDAIRLEEESSKIKSVSYDEQKQKNTEKKKTFTQLQDEIKAKAIQLNEAGRMEEYKACIEQHLGKDASVKDASTKQIQQLEVILDDLNELI